MEYCLVYFSNSTGLLEETELLEILQQSRSNNAKLGITGTLLYVKGSIVQVLEGEKKQVEDLYARIQADTRHKNVQIVLSRPIKERLFGAWDMGYETITTQQLNELQSIIDLPTDKSAVIKVNEPLVLKVIKLFYASNRYN